MSQTLLILVGVYLLACYAYGMVVLVRLWSGRRSADRPLPQVESLEPVARAREPKHEQDEQRLAA